MNEPASSARRVFVAGASGAIGRQLLPILVAAGHEVTGTTRTPAKSALLSALGAQPVVADLLDRDSVTSVVQTARPDVVIHLLTDLAGRDFEANSRLRISATRNLVDAAVAAGVRRMIAESIAFVYAPQDRPWREEDPLDASSAGMRSTVEGVQSLEASVSELPEGVILRYGILYGPGTWNSSSGLTGEQLRNQERPITGAVTSFIHVRDAAQATLLALDWPAGIVNIVDDEPVADSVWLPVFAQIVAAPPPRVADSIETSGHGASNAKARRLGWNPIYPSWRDGFRLELD